MIMRELRFEGAYAPVESRLALLLWTAGMTRLISLVAARTGRGTGPGDGLRQREVADDRGVRRRRVQDAGGEDQGSARGGASRPPDRRGDQGRHAAQRLARPRLG